MKITNDRGSSYGCDVLPDRDVVRVAPWGELDIAAVESLTEELDALWQAGFTRVVLDLSGLTFIDSSGLHLVVTQTAAARSAGHSLTLVPGPDSVQRVFALCGVLGQLSFATVLSARRSRPEVQPAAI